MKKAMALMAAVACVAFSGCATLGNGELDHVEETAAVLEGVAETGTIMVLENNPGYRMLFREAAFQFNELKESDSITYGDVMTVLNRLPVEELRSDEGRLVITSGRIILSKYDSRILDLHEAENLRSLVEALARGIGAGLETHTQSQR